MLSFALSLGERQELSTSRQRFNHVYQVYHRKWNFFNTSTKCKKRSIFVKKKLHEFSFFCIGLTEPNFDISITNKTWYLIQKKILWWKRLLFANLIFSKNFGIQTHNPSVTATFVGIAKLVQLPQICGFESCRNPKQFFIKKYLQNNQFGLGLTFLGHRFTELFTFEMSKFDSVHPVRW